MSSSTKKLGVLNDPRIDDVYVWTFGPGECLPVAPVRRTLNECHPCTYPIRHPRGRSFSAVFAVGVQNWIFYYQYQSQHGKPDNSVNAVSRESSRLPCFFFTFFLSIQDAQRPKDIGNKKPLHPCFKPRFNFQCFSGGARNLRGWMP